MAAPRLGQDQVASIQLSPVGFHGWADLYWQEYEALPSESKESSIAYLLLCRAMEIEFKAWHRQIGRTDGLIDRFRHDLVASYRALPKKHRLFSENEVLMLQQANSFYLSEGLENAEKCRAEQELSENMNVAGLRAAVERALDQGDRLNLRWW